MWTSFLISKQIPITLWQNRGVVCIVVRIPIRLVKTHDFAISLMPTDPDRQWNYELSKIPVKLHENLKSAWNLVIPYDSNHPGFESLMFLWLGSFMFDIWDFVSFMFKIWDLSFMFETGLFYVCLRFETLSSLCTI